MNNDPKGKSQIKLIGKFVGYGFLICVVAITVLAIVASPFPSKLQSRGYETKSMSQMSQLVLAIKAYQSDHNGRGPGELADLVPKYVDSVQLFLFESPYTTSVKPHDNLMNARKLIEVYSPYCYKPLSDGGFVIFERPGMWRFGKVGYILSSETGERTRDIVRVGHIVPADQFQQLLAKGFSVQSGTAGISPGEWVNP